MDKIAFIFPGQGAQETGMGLDMIYSGKGDSILQANDLLDFDLLEILENLDGRLDQTSYTQPALVAVSLALYQGLIKTCNIKPYVTAGLSLGEYCAHVVAGHIEYKDAIYLVRQRGLLMEKAGETMSGSMAAVLKGNKEKINQYCEEEAGIVGIANYNSPVQVVISGEEKSVEKVLKRLKADGTRVIPLSVSGAFHSPLMEKAANAFSCVLQEVKMDVNNGSVKVYSNVTGKEISQKEDLKTLLLDQLKSPVLWQATIENMIADGVETFIEIGPGKTLAGLLKKINPKVKVYNVNSLEGIHRVAHQLTVPTMV